MEGLIPRSILVLVLIAIAIVANANGISVSVGADNSAMTTGYSGLSANDIVLQDSSDQLLFCNIP